MATNKKYAFSADRIEPNLPVFSEKVDQKWISFGDDNNWPNYVVSLYNGSAMNRTAIISKQDGVIGQGLKTKNEEDNFVLKRANPEESWNDVFDKVTLDYLIFGGFALNIIWSNDGTTIAEIYHLDFSRIRSGNTNPLTNKVDSYFYCADWGKYKKNKPLEFPTFNPTTAVEQPSQIRYFFDYNPASLFYPFPSYSGGLNDIQIDIEVSKFHINNLANGLTPGLFIALNNGIPDPDARMEIYDEITMGGRGSENAGKPFIAFSEDKEHAPEVTPIAAVNSDYYIQLDARITSRILSAHRITSPLLLGLYHGGSGFSSSADEIMVAYSHFISTVIRPIQKSMLKVFDNLMMYRGYPEAELYIEQNKIVESKENAIAEE